MSPVVAALGVAYNAALRERPAKLAVVPDGFRWVVDVLARAAEDLVASGQFGESIDAVVTILAGARRVHFHVVAGDQPATVRIRP